MFLKIKTKSDVLKLHMQTTQPDLHFLNSVCLINVLKIKTKSDDIKLHAQTTQPDLC